MCNAVVIVVCGRCGVYSFSSGVSFRREPELCEEWRDNPNAVLERFDREGRLDELEAFIDRLEREKC